MTTKEDRDLDLQEKELLSRKRLPFVFDLDENIQVQGNQMGIFLQSLSKKHTPNKTWIIARVCLENCGITDKHPVYLMAKDIADLIDTDAPIAGSSLTFSGKGNGYHNATHMQEVILNATLLIKAHDALKDQTKIKLSSDDKALLLFSALSHDLGHDGKGNRDADGIVNHFRLEKLSATYATPFIYKYMEEKQAQSFAADFETILCTTDIGSYQMFLQELVTFYHGERTTLPDSSDIPDVLIPLTKSPKLMELAAMLCDADIFSSIAFNFACCWSRNLRLAAEVSGGKGEQAQKEALAGLVNFHEQFVHIKSEAGKLFLDNFKKIKTNAKALLLSQQTIADQSDL